jgi:tRNA(adenine34) deaminase
VITSFEDRARQRSTDERFMREAIAEARLGAMLPGAGEVGCVIVRDGEIVMRAHNEAEKRFDPTAHAEMVGIRRLCEKLKTIDLTGCTLYCTLQPCGMCTFAAIWSGIERIVYGATRTKANDVYFASRHFDTEDFFRDSYKGAMKVTKGVLERECMQLYLRRGETVPPEKAAKDPAH